MILKNPSFLEGFRLPPPPNSNFRFARHWNIEVKDPRDSKNWQWIELKERPAGGTALTIDTTHRMAWVRIYQEISTDDLAFNRRFQLAFQMAATQPQSLKWVALLVSRGPDGRRVFHTRLCEAPHLSSVLKRYHFEVTLKPGRGPDAVYYLVFEFAPKTGIVQMTDCSFGLFTERVSKRPPARLQGRLERISETGIVGWAWDPAAPMERLRVEVLDGDTVAGTVLAESHRRDLEKAGKGDGRHGFRLPLPSNFHDGKRHDVSLRVVGRGPIPGQPVSYQRPAERPYHNWEQYLNWSMHHRQFHYPLQEADMRVLGYMDRNRQLKMEHLQHTPHSTLASVIMPAFNRAGIIGTAIASVLRQTYPHWELLVVDDGSTDGTQDVVRSFEDPRIRLIELPVNGGVSAARNQGLQLCRGEVIAYLDSDNAWEADFLAIMVDALLEGEGWESAYCAQEVTEEFVAGGVRQEAKSVRFGPFNRSLLENRNYIDLNAFAHTRKLYETLGGFKENMRRLVDWDLILRYTKAAPPRAVPCLLSLYFHGRAANQITNVEAAHLAEAQIDSELEQGVFRLPLSQPAITSVEPPPDYTFRSTGSRPKPRRKRFAAIVIVSFEAAQYLDYCIQSVLAFTPSEQFELILVDNASGSEVQRVLDFYEPHPNVRVLRNGSNTGFTFASNQGIHEARSEGDIILLNNDAVVTEGWLDAIQEPLDIVPDVGLVVPRQTLLPKTKTLRTHVPFARPDRETDVNISAHHNGVVDAMRWARNGFVEMSFAPFFCVYITRECLNEAGLLDADNGRHYRSDRLYCDIVRSYLGKRIIYTPHSKLYHFLQQSTKVLRESDQKQFKTMFVENRWTPEEIKAAELNSRLKVQGSQKRL